MRALVTNRTTDSTTAEHNDDHEALHKFHNQLKGPFRLAFSTPGIDTGVALWTPETGETIIGVYVVFQQMFDVANEKIGIGVNGTVDADLGFQVPVTGTLPPATPTWPRVQGFGIPAYGSVATLLSDAPLVARTVVGGNTQGSLDLYVISLPA